MRVRLLELQTETDSLEAGRAAGRLAPEHNLRGWAALLPLEPRSLAEGLRQSGLAVLRGTQGALALGNLALLWGAARSLADALEREDARALAAELVERAAALEAAGSALGLGPPAASAAGQSGAVTAGRPGWTLPRSRLPEGRTLVMGVVNVTPDSFSDGGRFLEADAAVAQGLRLAEEGADLLDVGGESTNPFGAKPVDALEERRRVEPVVRELARRAGVPVSIDTTKAEVAEAALDAGAEVVNDVSGLARDPALAPLLATRKAALVLMHMRGTPQDMTSRAEYRDLHGEVLMELHLALERAREAGVAGERIVLDPGLGFAKRAEHSLLLLRRQRELCQLGRPLLLGPSRKSFIGHATGRPPAERLAGTLAACALSAASGAAILRVHDVREVREALALADAVRAAR
jgi:dihydropteroate synthase